MAKKTKNELIALSNSTFFDNDSGEIQPSAHRAFNNALIDSAGLESNTIDGIIGSRSSGVVAISEIEIKIATDYAIFKLNQLQIIGSGSHYIDITNVEIKPFGEIQRIPMINPGGGGLDIMSIHISNPSPGITRINIVTGGGFDTAYDIVFMIPISSVTMTP